jgi:hypothetical protein
MSIRILSQSQMNSLSKQFREDTGGVALRPPENSPQWDIPGNRMDVNKHL